MALGRTSLKRRTFITYSVGMSYLNYALEHKTEVLALIKNVRQQQDADVVVLAEKKMTGESIDMLDNYSNEMLKIDLVVNDAWESKATLSRKRPVAYLIKPGHEQAIKNLKILGLKIEEMEAEKSLPVEAYTVTDYFKSALVYEKVHRQKVETQVSEKNVSFPAGTSIVYLAQDKGNLAAEVLEPESENGFISFNVIGTSLHVELPIYRYMQPERINE